MKYWLMKSEPSTYSIDDLQRAPDGTDHWDGIRNYQARNFMRDEMKKGDRVLFYHSSTKTPAVVGTARVAREAYPDHTAWDERSPYHDPRSTPENPVWVMVDLQFERRFPEPVTREDLRRAPELQDMLVLRRGQRLSIQPVTREEFDTVLALAEAKVQSKGRGRAG